MAKKAKKRVATRKKSSKRGKASAKPARKKAAKRTAPKKAKAKVRRTSKTAPKPAVTKKWPPKSASRRAPAKEASQAARQAVAVPVETTIIDVIEEPILGVVVVTEYESVRMAPNESERLNKAEAGRAINDRTI
jgi:hypothetical protein